MGGLRTITKGEEGMTELLALEKDLLAYLLRQEAQECRRNIAMGNANGNAPDLAADRLRLIHSIAKKAAIESIELELQP